MPASANSCAPRASNPAANKIKSALVTLIALWADILTADLNNNNDMISPPTNPAENPMKIRCGFDDK